MRICELCGSVGIDMYYCRRCHPPHLNETFPFLVANDKRTAHNCLDLALATAVTAPDAQYHVSAIFKPSGGNGPYFVDINQDTVIDRVCHAQEGFRHFATVFRKDTPCFLHVDIDDSRPVRPPSRAVIENCLRFLSSALEQACGVQFVYPDDWLLCVSDNPDKTSSHCHALTHHFESVTDLARLVKYYRALVESAFIDVSHKQHGAALTVCWEDSDTRSLKHVLDYSIYHHNALVKLPYQQKPSKPPMLPYLFHGKAIEMYDLSTAKKAIAAALAHPVHIRKTKGLVVPTLSKKGSEAQRSAASARVPTTNSRELVASALASRLRAAVAFKETRPDGTIFYARYKGSHTCERGVVHDSNNATVRIAPSGAAFITCFATSCRAHEVKLARFCETVRTTPPLTLEVFNVRVLQLKATFDKKNEYAVRDIREGYLDLVSNDWAQINGDRVLYGQRRRIMNYIKYDVGLFEDEKTVAVDEWVTRDKSNFAQAVVMYQVPIPTISREGNVSWKNKKLADLWMDWCGKRVYESEVNEPDPARVDSTMFNRWTDLIINEQRALAFVQRRNWTREKCMEVLRPWINHNFHILADGNLEHYNYQQRWWARIIKKKIKNKTAILVMSDHGAGKSAVAERMVDIFGPVHACTISKSEELMGNFNDHLALKILCVCEEATYGGAKSNTGFLKHLITSGTIMKRAMYHPRVEIESRHNVIFFASMNKHVLPIETTERRMACFYPNPKFAGIQTTVAREYFDELFAVPAHLIAWFYYFEVDISTFSPPLDIPVTACTRDQKIHSIDSSARFILEVLQRNDNQQWNATYAGMTHANLFDAYEMWCEKQKLHTYHKQGMQAFMAHAKRHLEWGRSGKGMGLQNRLAAEIDLQRIRFSVTMNLPSFPTIDGEDEYINTQEATDPTETYGDLLMLKAAPSAEQIERVAKRRRVTFYDSCPRTCDGQHPEFIRKNEEGRLVRCAASDPQAISWHVYSSTAQ